MIAFQLWVFSLTEISFLIIRWLIVIHPTGGVISLPDPVMQGRFRPLTRRKNILVLYRIPVNVIEMPLQVQFISNDMIPKAFLPKVNITTNVMSLFEVFRKIPFEAMHYIRKGYPAILHLKMPVEVIWQNNIC